MRANASSASPPESINTTTAPAKYSSRRTAATIEIPASRSEPNWRRTSLTARCSRSGGPPATSTMYKGSACVDAETSAPHRSARCVKRPTTARTATVDARAADVGHRRGAGAADPARDIDWTATLMTPRGTPESAIAFTPPDPGSFRVLTRPCPSRSDPPVRAASAWTVPAPHRSTSGRGTGEQGDCSSGRLNCLKVHGRPESSRCLSDLPRIRQPRSGFRGSLPVSRASARPP